MTDRLAELEATKKVRLPCMRGECRPMDWCERCRYIVKIEAALTELVKIARSQKTALQDVQAVALNGAAPGADPLDVIDEIADNALAALADAGQEGKPEWSAEKLERIVAVMRDVQADCEAEAMALDGQPFNGRVVAEQFGNLLAEVKAVAAAVEVLALSVSPSPEEPQGNA